MRDELLHQFEASIEGITPPSQFTYPFHYVPHQLSKLAAQQVARHVAACHEPWRAAFDDGKMLGVLVVRAASGEVGFLAAASGNMAAGCQAYFVPPIYDLLQPNGPFKQGEARITAINHNIERLENSNDMRQALSKLKQAEAESAQAISAYKRQMAAAKTRRDALRHSGGITPQQEASLIKESQFMKAELKRTKRLCDSRVAAAQQQVSALQAGITVLKQRRKAMSEQLQRLIFSLFRVKNALGQEQDLNQIFRNWAGIAPPAGAGECAAPRLLQYAYRQGYEPLCMAEFWWGQSPASEVRHAGHFYPSCRSKCLPILTFMMQGLNVEPNPLEKPVMPPKLHVIYNDQWLAIVDKPAGMLTVPGKQCGYSLLSLFQAQFPAATGPMVVHRLDMATSGLVVVAKDKAVHKSLQSQFADRRVHKTYIALLNGIVEQDEGEINLPLRPNPDDRPRQMVDFQHGKRAVTRFKVLSRNNGITRIEFHPLTGRTHQLRVHASHPLGLNAPIVGDMLYGTAASRLCLHAAALEFTHPITGATVSASSIPQFRVP